MKIHIPSVHPETLPKLKLWTPTCPFFGVQSFSFGFLKEFPDVH